MANLEDFDALVTELLTEQTAAAEGAAAPKKEDGFPLHLGGKEYKFASKEDAERALERHMAQLETKANDAAARAEAAAQAKAEPPKPELKEGEVDPRVKAYVAALEKGDFKEMTRIQLSHGLFDGRIDDPQSVINDSLLRTAQMDRGNAVSTFLAAHQDLAKDPAAQSTVEQSRVFLGLPATPDGFEAAHAYAERKGLIQNSGGTQVSKPGAPPAPPRQSTHTGSGQPQTPEEWTAFAESIPLDRLERLINAGYSSR
jgi:phage host-nuclease inhibitor protein Gam